MKTYKSAAFLYVSLIAAAAVTYEAGTAFGEVRSGLATDDVSARDRRQPPVSHPPADASSDASAAVSLPVQTQPSDRSTGDLAKPPSSSAPDAPLPKPY